MWIIIFQDALCFKSNEMRIVSKNTNLCISLNLSEQISVNLTFSSKFIQRDEYKLGLQLQHTSHVTHYTGHYYTRFADAGLNARMSEVTKIKSCEFYVINEH